MAGDVRVKVTIAEYINGLRVCVPIILHERIYFVCRSELCAEGIPGRGKCVISFAVPLCSLFGMFAVCVLFCLYILPIRGLSHCKYGKGIQWE